MFTRYTQGVVTRLNRFNTISRLFKYIHIGSFLPQKSNNTVICMQACIKMYSLGLNGLIVNSVVKRWCFISFLIDSTNIALLSIILIPCDGSFFAAISKIMFECVCYRIIYSFVLTVYVLRNMRVCTWCNWLCSLANVMKLLLYWRTRVSRIQDGYWFLWINIKCVGTLTDQCQWNCLLYSNISRDLSSLARLEQDSLVVKLPLHAVREKKYWKQDSY